MEINWNKFIVLLLPIKKRTATIFSFIRAMLAPIVFLYNQIKKDEAEVNYELAHTSQVWSIEAVLNDAFDVDERRIYTSDSGGHEVIALFPDDDWKEIVLQPDDQAEAVIVLHPDSSYDGGEYDAIVHVPFTLTEGQTYRMKALINKYKLIGIRYDIRTL